MLAKEKILFNDTLNTLFLQYLPLISVLRMMEINQALKATVSHSLVQWLCKYEGLIPDQTTLRSAGFSGNLTLVKWLCDKKHLHPTILMQHLAASWHHQPIIDWVNENYDQLYDDYYEPNTSLSCAMLQSTH
ncbi:MAG: hypothetical protein CMF55_06465 [Legionellales bacterium]|nr:hypothetical protein [Legionellales bacterium]